VSLDSLDTYVSAIESQWTDIKPDNEARIVWHQGLRKKTPYSIVYLHGFEASWAESTPIHLNMAEQYGCNLYLSRISEQGRLDPDALLDETPEGMINSAKEAIAIGKLIGEKLIVMSCSTGATLSSYLAANDPDIFAQIMTSPNFDLADPTSKLLTKPWGKQILKQVIGDDYREFSPPADAKPYWNNRYRIEGLIALRDLLDQTMTEDIWRKNNTPTYIGYYYKDENNYDNIISLPTIDKYTSMFSGDRKKLKVDAFSQGYGHVISSQYMNDLWPTIQDSMFKYMEEVLEVPLYDLTLSSSGKHLVE